MSIIKKDDKFLRIDNCRLIYEFNIKEIKTIKRIAKKLIDEMIDEGIYLAMITSILDEARELIKEFKLSKN